MENRWVGKTCASTNKLSPSGGEILYSVEGPEGDPEEKRAERSIRRNMRRGKVIQEILVIIQKTNIKGQLGEIWGNRLSGKS